MIRARWLPLELTQAEVDDLKTHLPELPDEKKARFVGDYGLTVYDANVLVAERETGRRNRVRCQREFVCAHVHHGAAVIVAVGFARISGKVSGGK